MPFMLLLLIFLTAAVVWAFFRLMPHGVGGAAPLTYNIATLVVAAVVSVLVAQWIFSGAAADPQRLEKFGWYLAIMAGGIAFNIIVASAGLLRNFYVFPARHGDTGQPPP
jgi:hypothetical protein